MHVDPETLTGAKPARKPTLFDALASLRLTIVGLLLLLVLTVWGTLYQADNGLFQAQQRFYQSWFFLAGGVLPFPGAQTVMLILFVNLLAAMARLITRHRARWGLLATHAGLLLMLAAGAVTFYLGQESHLTMFEGESSNVSSSDHAWELAVWNAFHGARREVAAVDATRFRAGDRLEPPLFPGTVEVEAYHASSRPSAGGAHADDLPLLSPTRATGLVAAPRSKNPSDDLPGLLLVVRPKDGRPVRVLLAGASGGPAIVPAGDASYAFELRRRRFPLPATIRLLDFRREMHPGSSIAKSYSSQVEVRSDDGLDRPVLISMNKPLRLANYTFYQSSFQEFAGGREASTFAVVRNYGRTMPYVATGVTAVGMALHFLGILVLRLKRAKEREARP